VNAGRIAPEAHAVAAALASGGTHAHAQAIAASFDGDMPVLDEIAEVPGQGIEARLDGQPVRLGRGDWIGIASAGDFSESWLRVGDGAPVSFQFADSLRPEAAAVAGLQAAGLRITML
jgi:P-type Cu2+ transporter